MAVVPGERAGLIALGAGVLHAVGLLLVALHLGYAVGPSEYSLLGMAWRYGGLVALAALPTWLALRHRVVVPLLALVVTTGYVIGVELAPPGPTFVDVAELERLDEPTGIIVVEDGLYIVRYMVNASVWTVGLLLLGIGEYACRQTWGWLPPVTDPPVWLTLPVARGRAVRLAAAGGLLHALVMVWYAHRLGVTLTGGLDWVLYPVSAAGMWLLAAVPLYLLLRHRLVLPFGLLTGLVLFDAVAAFSAGLEDPHALYFAGWFVPLGLVLAAALLEYGARRLAPIGSPGPAE